MDVLYRFRGADLLYQPHDALYLVSLWDPDLFTERGRANLHVLASEAARHEHPQAHDARCIVDYDGAGMGDGPAPSEMIVQRLSRANPAAWMRTYDEALVQLGLPA